MLEMLLPSLKRYSPEQREPGLGAQTLCPSTVGRRLSPQNSEKIVR